MAKTSASTTRLSDYLDEWNPGPITQTDTLDPVQANRMAQTLDLDEKRGVGDELPLPWQWVYFPDWPATSALGADGHPAHGPFLPPIPDRRRMFAGSHIRVVSPLRLGVETEKNSKVIRVEEKHGRSGQMLFVTVRSEYRQAGEVHSTEEQSIVYRSDHSTARPGVRVETELAPSAARWSSEPTPATATLFRYSALTSNSHRIHYDRSYASDVEGYPDLVVHGPLLATYLADLARIKSGRSLQDFRFRLHRPLFLGDRFRVEADPMNDEVTMRVVSGAGTEHVTATGTLS